MTFKWLPIVDKYKLKQVNFEGTRYYSYGDARYHSITKILSWESRDGIKRWIEKVGKEEADKVRRESLPWGTATHKLCENYVNNENLTYYNPEEFIVDPLKSFETLKPLLDETIDYVHASEFRLHCNEPLYTAGTADLIFIDKQGDIAIGDMKTTTDIEKKRPFMEGYFKQLCFYGTALKNTYDMNAKTGYIFMTDRNMETETFKINLADLYADLEAMVLDHRDWYNNGQKDSIT